MFRYCPNCASKEIQFIQGKLFVCPLCGFTYYHNTAASSALIIESDGKIVTLIRGNEPGKGKLDFPGGFADPDEGIIDAIRRECREELSWDPGDDIKLFASFPNKYLYKNISYNTCDMFFTVNVSGLQENDFTLDEENTRLYLAEPESIIPDDFAFISAKNAFLAFLAFIKKRGSSLD